MKHAFLITAFKDPEHLSFLIDELVKYNSEIYVHIDKRTAELKTNLTLKYSSFKNIHILPHPVKVHWSGFSHLNAILILLNEAYNDQNNSYFHLISGQDIPLKDKKEFELFFENNNKDYITHFKLPNSRWTNGGLDRMEYYQLNDIFDPKEKWFVRLNHRFINLQKKIGVIRKQPKYIQSYYGGGTWWSLSRNAINAVINFTKQHPDFTKFFKNTNCSEEIFFQTILMNCNYKNEIINADLRYVNWTTKHGSCPAILDLDDLENIKQSKCLFARKIDNKISEELKNKLIGL